MLNYNLNEIKKKVKLDYRIYTTFNKDPLKYYNDDNIPMNPNTWFGCNIMYHKIPMQMAYDILIGKRDELAELCGIIHININDDLQLHSDNDEPSFVVYDISQDNITKYWHKNGKYHREDGPAAVCTDGSKWWHINGELHREDGPAVIYVSGGEEWYKNGEHHREDGPAIIDADGSKEWYKNGKRHREDGPAIIYANGSKYWYRNGELHREDGPAAIYADGTKYWCRNGKTHRKDGPAIIYADGSKEWYKNGKRHREDGPAIIYANGVGQYYLNDTPYSKHYWEKKVAELRSKRDKEKS